MATSIFKRAVVGLRSIRSSISLAQNPRTLSSFIKRAASYRSDGFAPLESSSRTYIFVRCASSASSTVSMTASAFDSIPQNEPVVSCDWLFANRSDPNVKVLDASWFTDDEFILRQKMYHKELHHDDNWVDNLVFDNRRFYGKKVNIPGALIFDVDQILDKTSDLPHMLPSEEGFAAAISALGIHNKDGVVVYDEKGIVNAARVWWMFRVFGHDKVWVLDGGLPKWRYLGYDVDSRASDDAVLKAIAASEAVEKVYHGQLVGPATFEAKLQHHLVWNLEKVKQNIIDQSHQLVDARPWPRFAGISIPARKGLKLGHVPGSKCIPCSEMLTPRTLLPSNELKKIFEREGISLDRPVAVSCSTGVRACTLALGLYRLGKKDVPVYDGSWAEWGSQPDTEVARLFILVNPFCHDNEQ